MIEASRCSTSRLPRNCGWSSSAIVFVYAVLKTGPRAVEQALQQERRAVGSFGLDERVERLEPLARLDRVEVGRRDSPERPWRDFVELGHWRTCVERAETWMIVRTTEHVLPKLLRNPALHSIICRILAQR